MDINLRNKYRTWVEIDTHALIENHKNIKLHIGKETKIYSVIKADAYGHGAIDVANILSDITDGFCVATASEGIELRNAGIENDIVLLGGTSDDLFPVIAENDITPTILSYESAINLAKCFNGRKLHIWIPVDTGMSRIGFSDDDEGYNEIIKINNIPEIEISGVFTHFAKADYSDKTSVNSQIKRFLSFKERLISAGVNAKFSMSNSAAILESEPKLDIVREGIVLYGVYPSDEVGRETKLTPILSMKSRIETVNYISKGTGVGYGHTYIAEKDMKIATVYCGYADGYPRALSNCGSVILNGKKAKIIGNICMDQMMIDISDFDDVHNGDIVTLIGNNGNETITVDEVAKLANTIPYEILCGLSRPRVPKIYL